jgi:hypothetical protein
VTLRSFAYEGYKIYCETFGLDTENDRKFTERMKDTKGITPGKVKGERAWRGVTFRELSEDGEIIKGTHGTDGTLFLPSVNSSESQNIEEYSSSVPGVPTVPDFNDKCESPEDHE